MFVPENERLANLEREVGVIFGILRGELDLEGRALPPATKPNPRRDPEAIIALRRRVAIAKASASKDLGDGKGRVRTKKQQQEFRLELRRLQKQLAELEEELGDG